MARLSTDQKDFLAHHNIPLNWLFDASGLARDEYSKIMRVQEKYFSYGVAACPQGHTLRSRARSSRIGNCIQCRPASIAFVKRHYNPAYVYIAGSMAGEVIKVGLSTEVDNRLYIANLVGYAGYHDWEFLFGIHVQQAALIESNVQSKLQLYQKTISFIRSGRRQTARECFTCSYQKAYLVLSSTLKSLDMFEGKQLKADQDMLEQHNFHEF